jgi:type IV pilus biogenesis protein PilP
MKTTLLSVSCRTGKGIALLTVLPLLFSTQSGFAAGDDEQKPNKGQHTVATYDELATLRAENALLKERLANAKLRGEIETARGGAAGGIGPSINRIGSDRSGARVLLVEGVGEKVAATIQLSDGANLVAKVGMRIPGLGLFKSIRTDEVIVQNGKEMVSIPFAAEPLSNTSSTASLPGASPSLTLPPGRN